MKHLVCRLVVTFLLSLAAIPAMADEGSGQACAQGLSPLARQIYAAVGPTLKPDSNIADVLRSYVRPQVMAGKMSSSDARPAAEAAGNCLQALRR